MEYNFVNASNITVENVILISILLAVIILADIFFSIFRDTILLDV